MKKIFIAFAISAFAIISCNNSSGVSKRDPLESGRGFIQASLKGDYVKAENYLLKDSTNNQYFELLRDFNKSSTPIERENYSEANIIIDSITTVSDSVNIIYYYNTYKKEPSKLKMVRHNDEWLVDFKYSFTDNPN